MHSKTFMTFARRSLYNKNLFEHTFTPELKFRSGFEKIPCFRVMDSEGNILNKEYENSIDDQTLKKMFKLMVSINEQDYVLNQA